MKLSGTSLKLSEAALAVSGLSHRAFSAGLSGSAANCLGKIDQCDPSHRLRNVSADGGHVTRSTDAMLHAPFSSPAEARPDGDAPKNIPVHQDRQNQSGQHRNRGPGHHVIPLRTLLPLEQRQPERQRRMVRAIHRDQWPKKRIPLPGEGEQRQQPQRGSDSGRNIVSRMRKCEAPSMRAASSSSCGMVKKN